MVVVQVVVTVSFLYIIADTYAEDDVNAKARIKVACTISQLICSNASKQDSQALSLYQRKERETPFPLYIALKLHANSRQKAAIATFHALGISVSYGRVINVRKDFAKWWCLPTGNIVPYITLLSPRHRFPFILTSILAMLRYQNW